MGHVANTVYKATVARHHLSAGTVDIIYAQGSPHRSQIVLYNSSHCDEASIMVLYVRLVIDVIITAAVLRVRRIAPTGTKIPY